LQIHSHAGWFGTIELVRQTHFIAMYVFVLTTVSRIYWAFFGAGSAALGGLTRHRDWKFFALDAADIKQTPAWITYNLFLRRTKPHAVKYGSLQKLTYGVLFPLGILVMALTGFAMFAPTASTMLWCTNLFGGLNMVRLVHYFAMWVLVMFFMIHFYLVIVEEPAQAAIMLFRTVPKDLRVKGDYPSETTPVQGERA
jgi:Ni/Fe-hydrogenase b-type cytochrome subunit